MAIQPKQTIQQRLLLTPNITLALEVLRMTTMELHSFLQSQLEENPMLELEESAEEEEPQSEESNGQEEEAQPVSLDEEWLAHWRTGGVAEQEAEEDEGEGRSLEERLTKPQSLYDSLRLQLGCQPLPDSDRRLGEAIINRLSEYGYLEGSLEELAAETGDGMEELERVLRVIQRFDPPGVGARDLRECLMLQLERRKQTDTLAYRILRDHFPHFLRRHLPAIASAAHAPLAQVQAACEDLKRLDPKPGRIFSADLPPSVIPDLLIVKRERYDDVELNDQQLPRIYINRAYHRMLNVASTPEEARVFLVKKFRQARWVIKAIDERNATILAIGRCLISLQREFVERGPQAMKPLTQAQVATLIGRHPSTVSRAIAGKTIDTPYGMFRLEEFFASGVPQHPLGHRPSASAGGGAGAERAEPLGQERGAGPTAPEPVSDAQIKSEIRRLIAEEDARHPLSDEALTRRLRERHIAVARRTIAKYRTSIKIPPAHLRRHRF